MKIITNSIRGSYEGRGSPQSFFPRLVETFGAQRIAWGSNFPASEGTLPELLAEAQSALSCLSSQDRAWIFAGTAQNLFPTLKD
jgi:predicted TIM-barrel fold metal-dependent hydrolase